jgi:Tol biopolymer transport system component
MTIAIGTTIGPYEIVGWLGAGGMGEVYRARDSRLAREVAIKLIPPTLATDTTRLRRFEQEARAAGQLNHPNILAVYDVGVHDGAPFIVSELLQGQSLRALLHDGALPPRRVLDYARQIAEGLAAAHDKTIVHRDIKPDNLFLTDDGRVKILDFGIAKLTRPNDTSTEHTAATQTSDGAVVGTAGYMSPEQVRGETVDARSDLFSVGIVVYEMLTGRAPFNRETAAESMTAILKSDPEPLPIELPPALSRIVSRCLEKTCEMRFQSARDLAFGLEVLSDTVAGPPVASRPAVWRRGHTALVVGAAALVVLATVSTWNVARKAPTAPADPFANAQFTRLTDWPGTEAGAAISPDGKFVAFVADKAGEFDMWLSQVGGGEPINLTADFAPLESVGPIFKKFGFSGDGAQIWFTPGTGADMAQMIVPLIGGARRAFLERNATAPAWSPDGERIVYFINRAGDPMFLADRTGANARAIKVDPQADGKGLFETGMHNHNPVWSWDGAWIYFAHGSEPTGAMDIWRMRPTGELAERLTEHGSGVNLLAPLDAGTVLYIGRAEDGSGPWLWALDVERKTTRRVSLGLGQYTSVSATRDGRRIVATIANPSATLWRAPLVDRQVEDRDVQPYPLKAERALAPRFSGKSLFYVSRSGAIDGLWKTGENEPPHQIWTGGVLSEPPVVSPDGNRVVVIARQEGKRRLVIMSTDGRSAATLAPSLEVQGFFAGQGMADWSPDGEWIVAGGTDATQQRGLFKVPVSGGAPIRLVAGEALNPLWSPDGKFIVYGSTFATGQVDLRAVSPEGTRIDMTLVRARPGGYRFLPDGSGLVYLPYIPSLDFSLFNFATKQSRRLTRLSNQGDLGTFDITPDGKAIVFDRSRENADIVLIDLPR